MSNPDILNLDTLKELERKVRQIAPLKIRVEESVSIVEQFRFPRSKKKRIRQKWSKNKSRNSRPSQKVLTYIDHKNCERVFIVHPSMAGQLRWELTKNNPSE